MKQEGSPLCGGKGVSRHGFNVLDGALMEYDRESGQLGPGSCADRVLRLVSQTPPDAEPGARTGPMSFCGSVAGRAG
jgi:hypothetical protein